MYSKENSNYGEDETVVIRAATGYMICVRLCALNLFANSIEYCNGKSSMQRVWRADDPI